LKNNKSFVYIFLDPRKEGIWYYKDIVFFNQPFYVGEGVGNRIKNHFIPSKRIKNSYKNTIINNIEKENMKTIIKVLFSNLSKKEALIIESDIIKTFKRKCNNEGILSNIFTFSNDIIYNSKIGSYKANNTEAVKKAAKIKKGKTNIEIYGEEKAKCIRNKISKVLKEGYNSGKYTPYLKGKKASKETKEKLSKLLIGNSRNLGKHHSEKVRKIMSQKISKVKGRPVKTIKDKEIMYFASINSAAVFNNISPQMLDEAFKNKNFCNSKKANCRFELITKEEFNIFNK